MVARMRAVIPVRWFPDEAPILNGVLSGLGAAWAWAFDLLSHVKAQTRLATASGVWLDVIAQDFCGARLMRRGGEGDDAFRNRIRRELLRERGTRSAVVAVLEDLTGRTPDVFEPGLTSDTGGYNSAAGGGGASATAWQAVGEASACLFSPSSLHSGQSAAAYRSLQVGAPAPAVTARARSNTPLCR